MVNSFVVHVQAMAVDITYLVHTVVKARKNGGKFGNSLKTNETLTHGIVHASFSRFARFGTRK